MKIITLLLILMISCAPLCARTSFSKIAPSTSIVAKKKTKKNVRIFKKKLKQRKKIAKNRFLKKRALRVKDILAFLILNPLAFYLLLLYTSFLAVFSGLLFIIGLIGVAVLYILALKWVWSTNGD